MSEVLVIGSLAYDTIETPSGRAPRTLGGSANYFSLSASLFAPVRVVGVVGEDYEDSDLKLLTTRRVDTEGLQKVPGKTFHWEGRYEGDLNEAKTINTELNVFEKFQPKIPTKYKNSKFVFLANIDPVLQLQVLQQVEKPVLVGMDTMNFWITSKKEDLLKVLSKIDVLLINEGEADLLTGGGNAIESAPILTSMGPKSVVVKRGEYGFILYDRDEGFFALPAFPVAKVIDPTGAGDTFAGAFFGSLAQSYSKTNKAPQFSDLKMACVRGTLAASFTIQDFGVKAIASTTMAQIEDRHGKYLKTISI